MAWKAIHHLAERVLAAVLLVLLAPFLLAVWLVWHRAGETPLLPHPLKRDDGTAVSTWRFRTAGRHTEGLDSFGRFLIRYGIEEWPGLGAVVAGKLSLSDTGFFRRRR